MQAAEALIDLPGRPGQAIFEAARVLAFNLPRSAPDPLAFARVPRERADELAERAMDYLEQSIARGHSSREELENDEDLEALRERPDFARLFDRLMDRGFPADPFVR